MALEIASPQKFFADPADALLADVAIRVQLSRTDYNKAVFAVRDDKRLD